MKDFFKRNAGVILHTVLTILGYLIFVAWFAGKVATSQEYLSKDINELKTQVQALTARIDKHIDKQ